MAADDRAAGRVRPPLADGAVTWSYGGTTELPWFEGLTEAEQRAGHSYGVLEPSGSWWVTSTTCERSTCSRVARNRPS